MLKRVCSFLVLLFLAFASGAAGAAISTCNKTDAMLAGNIHEETRRRLEDEQRICALPVDDITPATALTLLKGEDLAVAREKDAFTVVARSTPDKTHLCCTFQTKMSRIGETDLYAARFRAARLDEAMIMLVPPSWLGRPSANGGRIGLSWRGPKAPVDPTPTDPSTFEEKFKKLSREIVYKEFWSDALGETRRVLVYLPANYKQAPELRVLIVADGLGAEPILLEEEVRAGRYPPFVMIGLPSGQGGIVEDRAALGIGDLRVADYLPASDKNHRRFDRHLTFVVDELLPALRKEYDLPAGPRATLVAGRSNGAVFALFAALRRPDQIGAALVLSQGVTPAEPGPESPRARFFLSAGLYEPSFLRTTRKSAEILSAAGYDASFTEYVAGHAPDQWDVALIDGLKALFAAEE